MMPLLKTPWQQRRLALAVTHPKVQEMADAAEELCRRWLVNDPQLLVLVGNTGTGKTHTAKAVAKFARASSVVAFESKAWGERKVPSVHYLSWPEAAGRFNEKNLGDMEDAISADLLVLDDVGAENDPFKICADKFCQILSRREFKFTVLTTNIAPSAWAEQFDGRITDRLMRNSKIVNLTGVPSYAIAKLT